MSTQHTPPGWDGWSPLAGTSLGPGAVTFGESVVTKNTRRSRRRIVRKFAVLGPILFFLGVFFGVPYAVSPEPDTEISSRLAFATVDGRDVVLVPYQYDGARGMHQLMFQDMFQGRMSAVDLATGEVIWDVEIQEGLSVEHGVLAVGSRYVYLSSSDGLWIVELDDGEVVAEPDGIDGLGVKYVAELESYRTDPKTGAVLTRDIDGQVLRIELDSLTAVPADLDWDRLAASEECSSLVETGYTTVLRASLGGDATLDLMSTGSGSLGSTLRVTGTDDPPALPDTVFYQAGILVADTALDHCIGGDDNDSALPMAVGADQRFVVVEHQENAKAVDTRLSIIDLRSGAIVATTEGSSSRTSVHFRAGTVVMPVKSDEAVEPNKLLLVRSNGSTQTIGIGDHGFFGTIFG